MTLFKPDLIQTFPSPISIFDVSPKTTSVYYPNFNLANLADQDLEIFYIVDDSLYLYELNPKVTFVESGNHLFEQVVVNEYGCRDTTSMVVKIIPLTTVYIPNSFTPDGNKYNNEFVPVVLDASYYEMQIFNKWGEQIFYSQDPFESWDGTYKNKTLQEDVYTFKLIYRNYGESENIEIMGHVNLIR